MQICFDLHIYLLNLKYYDIKTCQVLIKMQIHVVSCLGQKL